MDFSTMAGLIFAYFPWILSTSNQGNYRHDLRGTGRKIPDIQKYLPVKGLYYTIRDFKKKSFF